VPDDKRLDDIAGSVSDDAPVDWPTGDAASLDALRDVARIAEFNRRLQRTPSSEAGGDDATPPVERWGELTLLEPVGAGARGRVWRAWDTKLQRDVALKFLTGDDPASTGSLLNEARALARVHHPGVVAVHGIAEHEGIPGMWMELLRGPTLAEEMERRGRLPADEVARIGVELCRALDAVVRADLVHGDLKPANIVLEDGRAVLTDFGLGRRRDPEDSGVPRVSGTPFFMAPELLDGEPPTHRSDVYALGVTLRWALTGRHPFEARDLVALKTEKRTGPARGLDADCPEAPEALREAIEQAMAARREDRFPDAAAMGAALQAVRVSGGDGTARAGMHPRGNGQEVGTVPDSSWGKTSGARTLLLAAAVVAVSAAAWFGRGLLPSPGPVTAVSTYEVEASLLRRDGGVLERLSPGDRVYLGESLSLRFRATRPAWVYVLNQDDAGENYLLFPQPRFDLVNPLPADSTLILPGAIGGLEHAWTVTSNGGREHFLVVASPEPIPEIESELGRLPVAKPDRPIQYASVSEGTVEHLRGVGGLASVPPDSASAVPGAFEQFEKLAGRESVSRGIWIRTVTLENGAP